MNEQLFNQMPMNADAEMAVIGALLANPGKMDALTGYLIPEDFALEEHRAIYRTMRGMYARSKSIDLVTLIDELEKSGGVEEDSRRGHDDEYHVVEKLRSRDAIMQTLRLIADTTPNSPNTMDYARIVRDKATLRALIDAANEIAEAAYTEDGETEQIVELAEARIFRIAEKRQNKSFVKIQDALMMSYERLNLLKTDPERVKGMPTGFGSLDRVLVGMGAGDLVIVGARPGMGKTAFAMNVAVSAAKRTKKKVCIFSLEMSAEQLVTRMLSSEGMIDSYQLRSGDLSDDEWAKLAHAATILSQTKILIDDSPGVTVAGMISKLRPEAKELGLIVIDYLQLMQSESRRSDNRAQEVAAISRALKLMAKEFGVPVICCAQLNRGPEGRQDKRPTLAELRDSGAIEQDADCVMFLYRPDYYDAKNPVSEAEVIVAKNRHGAVETVKLGWYGRYTKFTEIADNSDGSLPPEPPAPPAPSAPDEPAVADENALPAVAADEIPFATE